MQQHGGIHAQLHAEARSRQALACLSLPLLRGLLLALAPGALATSATETFLTLLLSADAQEKKNDYVMLSLRHISDRSASDGGSDADPRPRRELRRTRSGWSTGAKRALRRPNASLGEREPLLA
jgi:hypothetical protein